MPDFAQFFSVCCCTHHFNPPAQLAGTRRSARCSEQECLTPPPSVLAFFFFFLSRAGSGIPTARPFSWNFDLPCQISLSSCTYTRITQNQCTLRRRHKDQTNKLTNLLRMLGLQFFLQSLVARHNVRPQRVLELRRLFFSVTMTVMETHREACIWGGGGIMIYILFLINTRHSHGSVDQPRIINLKAAKTKK